MQVDLQTAAVGKAEASCLVHQVAKVHVQATRGLAKRVSVDCICIFTCMSMLACSRRAAEQVAPMQGWEA